MASSCQQAEEWFDQSLEGTLGPRQERDLRRHLEECPRCRRRLALEQRAIDGLAALRAEHGALVGTPPSDFARRIVGALPDLSPQVLGQIAGGVKQAAADATLRRRLQVDPRGTLAALGLALPPTMSVEAVTTLPAPLPTPTTFYLPLPETALQVEELEDRLAAMGLGAMFGLWW